MFERIQSAAHDGDFGLNSRVHPTLEQVRAGNYKKGRVRLYGLPIAIETPQGQRRTGKSDGKPWSVICMAHYGYIAGTKAADGDPIDVYIGPWPEAKMVYVVNQNDAQGNFDEVKVMMAFPTEEAAKTAYMNSYERGWTGFGSLVPCTIEQFKWWLKYGNTTIALTPAALPYDPHEESETMTAWDSTANPVGTDIAGLLYELRRDDADGALLDACTIEYIINQAGGGMALDALVVPFKMAEKKMAAMQRVMEAAGNTVSVTAMQVTPPFKQRGTTNVAAIFELSDGQTVSIFFHNPDTTPNKIAPDDELVSWKWMLNKKDITILVAPEKGEDLNVREVARRIMRIAEKNSAKFAAANKTRADRLAAIDGMKDQVTAKEGELAQLDAEIADLTAKVEAKRAEPAPAAAGDTGSVGAAVAGIKTRFTIFNDVNAPADWLVMNAPRPLLGTKTVENGTFLSGRFYAAISPTDEMASRWIAENKKLDAVMVLVATADEQMVMALNKYPEYKGQYLEMLADDKDASAIKSLLSKIQDAPYSEAVAMLAEARSELAGRTLYQLASSVASPAPAPADDGSAADSSFIKTVIDGSADLYDKAVTDRLAELAGKYKDGEMADLLKQAKTAAKQFFIREFQKKTAA